MRKATKKAASSTSRPEISKRKMRIIAMGVFVILLAIAATLIVMYLNQKYCVLCLGSAIFTGPS